MASKQKSVNKSPRKPKARGDSVSRPYAPNPSVFPGSQNYKPKGQRILLLKSTDTKTAPCIDPSAVRKLVAQHASLTTLVEYKAPVPLYEGKDAPAKLRSLFERDTDMVSTKSSSMFATVLINMFKEHQYSFELSTVLNMSSSGTGTVNSVIAVSTLSGNSEFAALAGVFNEFFVTRMNCVWQPNSRYNGPIGSAVATTATSLPIGLASLNHGAAAYTSLGAMSENYRFAYSNTSDPFSYSWHNIESPSSTVLPATAAASQSWSGVGNVASYQGVVQILSQSAPPALPVTAVLGTFAVSYRVLFRIRT